MDKENKKDRQIEALEQRNRQLEAQVRTTRRRSAFDSDSSDLLTAAAFGFVTGAVLFDD